MTERTRSPKSSEVERREVITTFVGIIVLVFDVVHDHFVCDGSRGSGKVASGPEVTSPELFVEYGILLE